jgi:hypothetical protein
LFLPFPSTFTTAAACGGLRPAPESRSRGASPLLHGFPHQ